MAQFKVVVKADDSGRWAGNQLRFDTIHEADAYGRDLASRWLLVRDWRVLDAEEDDNAPEEGIRPMTQESELDIFTRQYIATALWSSTADNGDPLDRDYDFEDIFEPDLNCMKADCKQFFEAQYERIKGNPSQAGYHFWLTRNGHGAGFWDGDWPEHGDALTEYIAAEFPEYSLYAGDDGKIYGS